LQKTNAQQFLFSAVMI